MSLNSFTPFLMVTGEWVDTGKRLILKEFNPVFFCVPLESVIREHQPGYYDALAKADSAGESTVFIEFMSEIIYRSLEGFYNEFRPPVTPSLFMVYLLIKGQT